MSSTSLRIGVVGYEGDQFSRQQARELLGRELRKILRRHLTRRIEVISDHVDSGVPEIARQLAEKLGMKSLVSRQSQRKKEEEVYKFVRSIHGLIRVGGDSHSRRIVRLFRTLHQGKPLQRMLKEHEVDFWGEGPPLPILPKIRGLQYVDEFLGQDEQVQILERIDQKEWSTELSRRVQHFGYKYDYRKRSIDADMKVADLPIWLDPMQGRMKEEGLLPLAPDQLIINEYQPGQGIADHVDCEPCFGDTIVSISLGSTVIMNLTSLDGTTHHPLTLRPGSALVLSGPARYEWKHGIIGRKSDVIDGMRQKRTRRVSLTFRKVMLSDQN